MDGYLLSPTFGQNMECSAHDAIARLLRETSCSLSVKPFPNSPAKPVLRFTHYPVEDSASFLKELYRMSHGCRILFDKHRRANETARSSPIALRQGEWAPALSPAHSQPTYTYRPKAISRILLRNVAYDGVKVIENSTHTTASLLIKYALSRTSSLYSRNL